VTHTLGKKATVVVEVVTFCVVNFNLSAFLVVEAATENEDLLIIDRDDKLKRKESSSKWQSDIYPLLARLRELEMILTENPQLLTQKASRRTYMFMSHRMDLL